MIYWSRWAAFCCLIVTTAVSTVLLVATAHRWTITGGVYTFIIANRATTQLAIQLFSGLLGLVHSAVVCRLIDYNRLLYLSKGSSVSVDRLRGWIDMSIPRIEWDLMLPCLILVLLISSLSLVSSALWVGAMTPVASALIAQQTISVPAFNNTSLIKEYPSEIKASGPQIYTRQGLFSYSVGIKYIGSLVASASSATTADGSVRKHAKIDNTQFSFEGRSYGVGAAVGLRDEDISSMNLATGYHYTEAGYEATVNCIYNSSTGFIIKNDSTIDSRIYPVTGSLPDSVEGPEYSEYVGHRPDAIVAMGVAYSDRSPRRYVAIAAGDSYAALNATQCTVDFFPWLFNVSVNLGNHNITITKLNATGDVDPQRNLTKTVVRQFELIANDLTSIYESVLGDALMGSVTAWNASNNPTNTIDESVATLGGVTNALTAMVDDMLSLYAAAQLMVGNFSQPATAQVSVSTLAIGQSQYIITIAVINLAILIAVVAEATRTRGWRGLPAFDFADHSWLLFASFNGGTLSAQAQDLSDGGNSTQLQYKNGWLGPRRQGNALVGLKKSGYEEEEMVLTLRDP